MGGRFSKKANTDSSNRANSKNDDSSSKMSTAVTTWNIAAAATVLLPLLLFLFGRLFNREEGGGEGGWSSWWGGGDGGGQEEGWWWRWFRNDGQDEEQNGGSLVVVYVWSLVLFGALVWLGNKVLGGMRRGKEKNVPALFVAVVAFANLALLLWILIQSQVEMRVEEPWLSQFPSAMILTFLFWVLFGVVYAVLLQQKYGVMDKLTSSSNGHDYFRHQDDGEVV